MVKRIAEEESTHAMTPNWSLLSNQEWLMTRTCRTYHKAFLYPEFLNPAFIACLTLAIAFTSVPSSFGQVINDFAQPIATTVQLPTFGVSFDAEGVLQIQAHKDPTGELIRQRMNAANNVLVGDLRVAAPLRKVSLSRLEAAARQHIADGVELSESMKNLAGLTRITAAFCYPDRHDIVIAGPAEPWIKNLANQSVGIHSGRATLQLQDFVVALRTFSPDTDPRVFVGCTISPTTDGVDASPGVPAKNPVCRF